MSKTMRKKDQKAIQEAEEIIAEVKQNGLKDGALIVLYATGEDGGNNLDTVALGKTTPALAALGSALIEVCETSGYPLTRAVSMLLRCLDKERGRYDETL